MSLTRKKPEAETDGRRTGRASYVKSLVALHHEKKEAERVLTGIKKQIAEVEPQVMDHLTQMGYDHVNVDGTTIYIKRNIRASISGGINKSHMAEVFAKHNMTYLIKPTVNANSLASYFRNEEDALDEPPENIDDLIPVDLKEFVNIFEQFSLGVRQS
jgi:hypothetical protein